MYPLHAVYGKEITNTELAQKCGVHAIGEAVCRDFGPDGIFYGTVNAFRRESTGELYTVRYTDGDQEDLDTEEYNFAYALWLTEEGWNADEGDVDHDDLLSEEDEFCEPVPQKHKSTKKVSNALAWHLPSIMNCMLTFLPL